MHLLDVFCSVVNHVYGSCNRLYAKAFDVDVRRGSQKLVPLCRKQWIPSMNNWLHHGITRMPPLNRTHYLWSRHGKQSVNMRKERSPVSGWVESSQNWNLGQVVNLQKLVEVAWSIRLCCLIPRELGSFSVEHARIARNAQTKRVNRSESMDH